MKKVLVSELIDDFVVAARNREEGKAINKKLNKLRQVLGSLEMAGLLDIHNFYSTTPVGGDVPEFHNETIQFLKRRVGTQTTFIGD